MRIDTSVTTWKVTLPDKREKEKTESWEGPENVGGEPGLNGEK